MNSRFSLKSHMKKVHNLQNGQTHQYDPEEPFDVCDALQRNPTAKFAEYKEMMGDTWET